MKPPPAGWSRINPSVFYGDANAAIDWLCRVFGFAAEVKIQDDSGDVVHSQLRFGDDGLIMVGSARIKQARAVPMPCASPMTLDGANTQCLCLFVDDADAHCQRAREEGADILDEPSTQDYGPDYWSDRTYRARDLEGHHWWFMQRLRG